MHGRLKVKTTAEQQAAKLKEQEKKLKLFSAAWNQLIELRKKSEYGKETLELSGQILCKIPDVHTLWNIRRETFLHLKSILDGDEFVDRCKDELAFTEHCLRVNPKSYGCWEHRCWVMDNSPKPDWATELTLCNRYLELDERNFHCWDYRRFVVARSATSEEAEFDYTTSKISANFSNFSSWHYRSKLMPNLHPDPENPSGIKQDVLLSELNLVQNAFFTDPNDQSAWFYHRWLLGKADIPSKCSLVHLSADRSRLLLRFTETMKTIDCKLMSNSETFNAVWEPISLKSKASKVWSCRLPKPVEKGDVLNMVVGSESFELKTDTDEMWIAREGDEFPVAIEFGKAAKDVLVNELDMLKQLHELEPENKWTMLTIIALIRYLNPIEAVDDIKTYLAKLTDVDPYRVNYYNDMRSKYLIENELRTDDGKSRCFDLSSRNLTTFYHSEHFLLILELDLSNNQLENLKGLHVLQNLKKLNASKNRIASLVEIGVLNDLEELNLNHNSIAERSVLSVVKKQPKLRVLHLEDNPVEISADEEKELLQRS